MANEEENYRRAVASGDTQKAVEAYEAYKDRMEASNQTPKAAKDL